MRRLMLALALVAVALVAAACSTSSAPGWTYAPPTPAPSVDPSASAAPSDGASAAPSGSASAAPSASAGASASAAPSGGAGTTVQVSAVNIAFEQAAITAPADTAFTIAFENKEAVPHNVEIKDGSGASVFNGEPVTGPTTVDYQVGPLAAGAYTFVCTIHPNMTGTLTVGS
jgi:plastocyanin